ncbi:PAS domain-containing sensor histidine kinase [Dictyobacter aurantiacus]|uniref:histidine kinase n=1 Tax=Dictyobacter aurantiacus TaxID=1936993 RepID=A0A401ZS39_9CHLR|nr:PAS domain S-box protein [Dictyobacter aurantiacus]GCE09604.1 hypothetical protein KDAU_69330 [Dictyobacter aurantiacus]
MQHKLYSTIPSHFQLQHVNKLQALLEAIPDGVVKVDATGCLQSANAVAQCLLARIVSTSQEDILKPERMAGLRARDMQGQLLTPDTIPIARMLGGETLSGQNAPIIHFPTHDGQELYVQISGAPLQNEFADLVGAVVILRDMTEYVRRRRYLEEMLWQGAIEQRRLRTREERARRISALVADSAYSYQIRVDGEIKRVWLTDTFKSITGYTPEEIDALGWLNPALYHADDAPAVRERRRALLAGASDVREWRLITKDGEIRWLRDSCHPIKDQSSGAFHFYGAVHDITSHKKAEEQIHHLSQQLSTTFAAIADGIVIYDREGQVLQMNQAARDLLGFDGNETFDLLPMSKRIPLVQMRMDEQLLALEQTPLHRVLHGEILKGPQAEDIFITALDGQQRCLNISGAPIRNLADEIIGGVLIFRDVTVRRRQELRTQHAIDTLLAMAEALAHSMEQLNFPDNMADQQAYISRQEVVRHLLSLGCDLLGAQMACIVTIDSGTYRLVPVTATGLPPESEERFWREMPHVYLHDYLSADFRERLLGGEPVLLDVACIPKADIATFGMSQMLVAPLHIGEQCLGLLIMDAPSVQQEYPLSEALTLIKVVGKLTALVIERERLIHERIIAQIRSVAESEANRQKDNFLRLASRELRTPLATIKAGLQLTHRKIGHLPAAIPDPGLLEQIDEVLNRGERQVAVESRLIGDLLDVSRIQEDRLELQSKLCNLLDVVRNVVADLRTGNTLSTIQIIEPVGEDMIPVVVDVERIGQVLTNYLNNAIKYSPVDKAITIRFELDNMVVRVSICDEGPGIARELQSKIWSRFYQVPDRIVYSGSSGLGLGLYICQKIIRQHNGQVGVISSPGQGATFWFTLPLALD